MSVKGENSGLICGQFQPTSAQPFGKYSHYTTRIIFQLKQDKKVIRISHIAHFAMHEWPNGILYPVIQYIVKINISQYRRNKASLWSSFFVVYDLFFLHNSGFKESGDVSEIV